MALPKLMTTVSTRMPNKGNQSNRRNILLAFANEIFISKVATAACYPNPTKKNKRLRHKRKASTQSHLLFRFLLVFLSAFAGREAYKNYHYAKAASYHFPPPFGSLPFQSFIRSCSSFAFLGV